MSMLLKGDFHGGRKMEANPKQQSSSGRNCVFCLTFGDMVLKNDLNGVRNDLQRKDRSGPIEMLSYSHCFLSLKQMANDIVEGMKMGIEPIPVHGGLGGAYLFRNEKGQSVAIVKPSDEEPYAPNNPKGLIGKALGLPGVKASVRVGETGFREVAAFLLDYDHFANVPPTALVKITHSVFNVNDGMDMNKSLEKKKLVSSKIASFQKFVPHDFDASEHGSSSFPVSSVHRIGILDIRILNTDRHGGNLLVKKLDDGGVGRFGQVDLIPIDHGLCLPETLEDPYFEWIYWPQASVPFSEEEIEYIQSLDPVKDCEMLRRELPMIREGCLRVLFLCTVFLKAAAGFGLCLAEIAEMMTRGFRAGEEEPSELEKVCIEAKRLTVKQDENDTEFQFGLDDNDIDMDKSANVEHSLSPNFVKLAEMKEVEWVVFLEKFQELLYSAFAERKTMALRG